jgi:ACS family hexuronate transporter-like MFS transporter
MLNPEPEQLRMETQKTSYRWRVVALLFCATTINYLDRQVLGLLKPTLEADFGWTESDFSHIVMAFQAAYAFSLIGFGAMIDKIGTKMGYVISVVVWSIAAMLHAIATGTFSFGLMRAILGLGEAGNFPVAIKATAEWFPKKERALATGIFNSGANIGAVVAPIMVPWILGAYGWQEAFLITGAIGFVWLIFWWRYYEVPAKHNRVNQAEYDYIHSDNEPDTSKEAPVKWLQLFKVRQTWAFVFGKMLTDPIWWFFLYWLPSYFAEAFKLNLSKPSPRAGDRLHRYHHRQYWRWLSVGLFYQKRMGGFPCKKDLDADFRIPGNADYGRAIYDQHLAGCCAD